MLREITVKAECRMEHRYAQAPAEVAHLRNLHSHMFKVELSIEVSHNDRELEFLIVESWLKKQLEIFNSELILKGDHKASCEMIAEEIIEVAKRKFGANRRYKCTVSEDGIVSATLTTEDEYDRWVIRTSKLVSAIADEYMEASKRQTKGERPSGYMRGLIKASKMILNMPDEVEEGPEATAVDPGCRNHVRTALQRVKSNCMHIDTMEAMRGNHHYGFTLEHLLQIIDKWSCKEDTPGREALQHARSKFETLHHNKMQELKKHIRREQIKERCVYTFDIHEVLKVLNGCIDEEKTYQAFTVYGQHPHRTGALKQQVQTNVVFADCASSWDLRRAVTHAMGLIDTIIESQFHPQVGDEVLTEGGKRALRKLQKALKDKYTFVIQEALNAATEEND